MKEEVCGLIPLKGSFSRLKLLPACEEQGLCLGVSHPGEWLASGRFSEESNTGEK